MAVARKKRQVEKSENYLFISCVEKIISCVEGDHKSPTLPIVAPFELKNKNYIVERFGGKHKEQSKQKFIVRSLTYFFKLLPGNLIE